MPDEIREIIEAVQEQVTSIKATQDRDALVIYGSDDIHLSGLITRIESVEKVIENINGLPEQVECLDKKVSTLIETDKKRLWLMGGIVIGVGLQLSSSLGLLDLIKGLLV